MNHAEFQRFSRIMRGGIPLELLASMPLVQLWSTLGLPPRVLVDELGRLNEIGPITLSGR